jgi:hypothetical protein
VSQTLEAKLDTAWRKPETTPGTERTTALMSVVWDAGGAAALTGALQWENPTTTVAAVVDWPLVPVGRAPLTTPLMRSEVRLPSVARDRSSEAEICRTKPSLPTHTVIVTDVLRNGWRIWDTWDPSLDPAVRPARGRDAPESPWSSTR